MKAAYLWAVLVAILASALRLPQIELRPMHADEAILADKFGTLLDTGAYRYDSADYHGPVLPYATLLPAYIAGQSTYRQLSESTLRAVPAIAGILLSLTPLLLIGVLGKEAAVTSAILAAVSPANVYYSRFYIPEALLALFTAVLLVALLHAFTEQGMWSWIAAAGASLCAFATKETAVIAIGCLIVASIFAFRSTLRLWHLAFLV